MFPKIKKKKQKQMKIKIRVTGRNSKISNVPDLGYIKNILAYCFCRMICISASKCGV